MEKIIKIPFTSWDLNLESHALTQWRLSKRASNNTIAYLSKNSSSEHPTVKQISAMNTPNGVEHSSMI